MNTPASPYRLLGILDPDRQQMPAFALKVPTTWKAEQSFRRHWEGAMARNLVYISLSSPDGRSKIEYLPAASYMYSEGPFSQNLRMQKQSMGMPPQLAPNELPPMAPVAYIKQNLLSYLAQNGLPLSDVGNEQEAPPERSGKGEVKKRGSIDGRLPNGRKVRVECSLTVNSRQINGDTYHAWTVIPSITQTDDGLDAAHAHTLAAQNSIVMNPAWTRLEEQTQNRGAQLNSEASQRQHQATMNQIDANTTASTRAHEQRMQDIRSSGEANTARFNERMVQMDRDKAAFDARMADSDRQQRISVDTIREESQYVNPDTGERVRVEDGHNHVYRSNRDPNVYLGADTPLDSSQVDWQELQKVPLKDY